MRKIKRTFGFLLRHPIAQRHIFKALSRFLSWQIRSNLLPKKFLVMPFLAPIRFYARKGLAGITGNIYAGLHDFYEMSFLLHLLREDDWFFDIGANVGSYTLLASGVCKSRTVAMEPIRSTFQILERNIALNNLGGRVTAINAAAGAAGGTLAFTGDAGTNNHVIGDGEISANITEVPVFSIDDLPNKPLPALVKIDVEGFETEVLKGMRTMLDTSSLKALIIELNGSGGRYGFDEEQIHQSLLAGGFSPCAYDPFEHELKVLDSRGPGNTIYCKDIAFVVKRLRYAQKFKVMGELI